MAYGKGSEAAGKTAGMREWLRKGGDLSPAGSMFMFSTSQAYVVGAGTHYTSTILRQLANDEKSGVSKVKVGVWKYDPEWDDGRTIIHEPKGVQDVVAGRKRRSPRPHAKHHGVMGKIIIAFRDNPGKVFTSEAMAEEAGGLVRNSAGGAMKRLSERTDTGVRMLARGVFIYEPVNAANLGTSETLADAKYQGDLFTEPLTAEQADPLGSEAWERQDESEELSSRLRELDLPAAGMLAKGDILEVIATLDTGEQLVRSADGTRFFKLAEL